jgi:hypothetical protein
MHMKGNYEGALFHVALSNRTAKNINAQIVTATYITAENNQYPMRNYLEGHFMAGVIYAGCTVEPCVIFDLEQVRHVRSGHKIVLDLLTDGTKRCVVLQAPPGLFDCFVATAAFGTEMATEVVALRSWRDRRLRTTAVGQLALAIYYSVSPSVARWIRYRPAARMVVRGALRPFVWFASRSIRRAR